VRVAIDSSVLIAAYISRAGVCAELLEDVLMEHDLICSEFILDKLTRKLEEKFHFPAGEVRDIRESINAAAEIVVPIEIARGSCRDPEDLPVLGSAVAGKADLLITVDKDLLELIAFAEIPIVRPGEFWKRQSDLEAGRVHEKR
jgi:uncharacterized protein